MSAVLTCVRVELRTRWLAWLGLALVIAVAGGTIVALAAGARRTGDAYSRLVAHERPPDVQLYDRIGETKTALDGTELARLPEVAEIGKTRAFTAFDGRTDAGLLIGEPDWLDPVAPLDPGSDAFFGRTKLLSGRRADPADADEVVVSFTAADRYGLKVGDTFTLRFLRREEQRTFYQQGRVLDSDAGLRFTLHVVGIDAPSLEFPPRKPEAGAGRVVLSRAFAQARGDTVSILDFFDVRLRLGPADLPRFAGKVEQLAGGASFDSLSFTAGVRENYAGGDTEGALRQLVIALWVLAAFSTGGLFVVVGLASYRQAVLAAADHPILRALGMTSAQLVAVTITRSLIIAFGGAAGSVAVAVTLSPLFPLGLARMAEPQPGVAVDAVAWAFGAGTLLVVLVTIGGWTAWRTTDQISSAFGRHRTATHRPSALANALGRVSFPVTAVTGTRLALEPGQGTTAVVMRSTFVGAMASVAILAAALMFDTSAEHLLSTPRLYGWNWDIIIGEYNTIGDWYDEVVPVLRADPAVAAFSVGSDVTIDVDGISVVASGLEAVQGQINPTVVEGRAPSSTDEILLTNSALEVLGAEIGDIVQIRDDTEYSRPETSDIPSHPFHVVGKGVLPPSGGSERGLRAAFTFQGLAQVMSKPLPRTYFPVRFRKGVRTEVATQRLRETIPLYVVGPDGPRQPADLVRPGGGADVSLVVAGIVGLVAAAMLAHLLLSSIRSRRRDLAVLRMLGFLRRQVALAVVWQATTLAGVALVVGLPIGLAAGRLTWSRFAQHLGVVPEPAPAFRLVVQLVSAVILVADLVAVLPARMASGTQPAEALRAE